MLNPVLRREAISAMRTWRTLLLIAVYTLALAIIALFSLLGTSFNEYSGLNPKNTVAIYIMLSSVQAALIFLFVPAISAGSISGERERQTLDLMLVTKTSVLSIVFGKLMSSLLIVILMIIAALPVFGIVMFFDSATISDLLLTAVFSIITAAMIGSVSILISSIFRKTVVAVSITYLFFIVFILGSFLGLSIYNIFTSYVDWAPPLPTGVVYALSSLNPILGLLSIFDTQQGYTNISSYISSASYRRQVAPTVFVLPSVPLWVFNLIFNIIVIIVSCLLASIVIKPTGTSGLKRKNKARKG